MIRINSTSGRRWIRILMYLSFLVVVAYLAYQLPYCHDDWKWGLPARLRLMKRWFRNYNGRYLGNITILLLTRSVAAKVFIPTLWMIWLLKEIDRGLSEKNCSENKNSLFLLLLGIFLLTSLPQSLFQQTYGWFSGFANYVPPAILFLAWFNWTESIYTEGMVRESRWKLLALPLGVATQLFCEHVTLFAVVYALWMVIYTKAKSGKVYLLHLLYLSGTVLGAVLMFSNTAYRADSGKISGYKSISASLTVMVSQLRETVIDFLFINNWLLNSVLAITLIWLLIRRGKRSLADTAIAIIVCGYAFYSVWHSVCPEWVFFSNQAVNDSIELLMTLAFFVSVLLCIWRNVDPRHRLSICILLLCSAAAAAPLMAVSPTGARCYYFCYVMQCMALLKLIQYLLQEKSLSLWYPALVAAVAVTVLGAVYIRIYMANGVTDRYRQEQIEAAVESGAEEVVLPIMPYPSWRYMTEPVNDSWLKNFKEFYGIPEDMTVVFQ